MQNRRTIIFILVSITASINCLSQDYYIETKDKKKSFEYYFNVMDSLIKTEDTPTCINCVRFMQRETKIPSSGKTTYFGRLDFTRGDLERWRKWYNSKYKITRSD
jgi:hypothetical protein